MNERLIRFAVIIICLIAVLGNKSSTQAHEIVGMSILDTITRPQTQMVNIAAISTGGNHACVLTSVGGVMCWGGNYYGQLGDGTTASARSMPMDVVGLSSGIIAVAAGADHTCAVTLSGGVKCWGRNLSGQVGDGTTNDRRTPVDVIGLSSNVMTVTAAADHTCALMTTGSVKCWGKNEFGKLGDGTTDDRLTPADVVGLNTGATAVTAGWNHTCALTSVGGIKCWGRNSHGKLGDGTTDDRLTPVDVVGLHTGAIAITAGEGHTCVLLSTGTAKCWGWNIYGQVGDSTTNDRFTPVDVVGLNSSVATITTLADHTCALTLGGDAKCWGWNFYGQLGDDTTNDRSAPVDVVGLGAGVAAVALGSFHTCALMSNGGIKCWGENFHRQLGDGTTNHSSTPVDVVLESSNDSALQPIDETIYANGPVYPGGTVGISLKVQNTTEQTIDSGQVSVWVSTIENGEPINNNLISQRSIATINGGEASEEGTLFAQVPLSLNAGTYYLVMDVQNTSVAASSVDSVHTPATHRRSIQFTAENCATGSLFCDVQSDETFYNEIMEVYGNGIMEPCSADQVTGRVGFCPEAWIYREELAEPLLKLYHNDSAYETTTTYRGTFVDVSSSNEHANAIQELFDLGLTTGCAGTAGVDLKFCPAPRSMDGVGYTTRTHMALFLARALQWDLSTPAQGIFADVTGDSPNARAIEQMWYHGFTTGPSSCSKSNYTSANGRIYCPDDYVTRGHIAAFLARAFGYVGTTPPQFSITGKVTNRNNQGVGAVTITLVHNPKESPVSSITQNDGSFTFSEIPAGPYLLHLKKDGYSFSTGDAGTNPYFPDVLTDNVTGLDFRGGRKDDLTIINLTVCYYSSVDEGNRQNYTTAFQYFADTVYDMTNGAHKIGTVTMLQNCTEGSIPTADIIWGNQGQPMAFGSGYGHDSKYLFFYDDAYWKGTEHFHIPHGKRLDCAGQTLAHEVGHYVYGLLDEYWGDNSGVQKSIMSRQLGNCLKNIYWRNFSTSNNHQASPENGQHNVYEASAWETLNRPSTADPKNGQFAGFEGGAEVILDRIYFPALKTVAPDPGNDPTVEIPGQENEARSALNVN